MVKLITEFLERKQEIKCELSSKSKDIIEHICKLILMPTNDSVNHWRKEIYGFLNNVKRLKGSDKLPTEKQIFNWTYNAYAERLISVSSMTLYIKSIIQEYSLHIENSIDYTLVTNQINNFCKEYFMWISKKLSANGYVPLNDIYSKLDKLIDKYSYFRKSGGTIYE